FNLALVGPEDAVAYGKHTVHMSTNRVRARTSASLNAFLHYFSIPHLPRSMQRIQRYMGDDYDRFLEIKDILRGNLDSSVNTGTLRLPHNQAIHNYLALCYHAHHKPVMGRFQSNAHYIRYQRLIRLKRFLRQEHIYNQQGGQ